MTKQLTRRQFLSLGAIGGLGGALGGYYLRPQATLKRTFCLSQSATEASSLQLRFVVVGDVGRGNRGQYLVADAIYRHWRNHAFPLVLLTGDNIYEEGEIEKIEAVFERPYQALHKQKVQFYGCLGNHDIKTNQGVEQIQYPGFNMRGRYYTFTRGPVQFFALDTNLGEHWDRQLAWLEETLAKTLTPWKVVYGHHPIYSSGRHGSQSYMIESLTGLFARYEVQLYCCGHDHHYERTQALNGTTYLICGAGSRTTQVSPSVWTAYANSKLSFAAVEVFADQMKITGIDINNCVFDQGDIHGDNFEQT